jgi:hypothetical protein
MILSAIPACRAWRADRHRNRPVRYALAIAVLLSAPAMAAAQSGTSSGAPAQRGKAAHNAQRAARPLPVVIPQQFAPAQEVYASLPETAAAAAPVAPSACQQQLAKIAVFQPLPTLVGAGECGATDAVEMTSIIMPDRSQVAVTPAATMRCPMAAEVAAWVRDDVAPSLKNLPPLRGLDNFASYDCRGRNNVRAAQLSEHGRADALDVGSFKLADGRELGLTDIHIPKDWRETIRSTVCARFSTVLGPGSDGYHEEHIHLDLEARRNNYKICEWDVRVPPPPVEAKATDRPAPADSAAPADDAATADTAAAIPADEVPLPRPRPVAQIERALSGHRGAGHRSSLDDPLNITAQ